MNYRSPFLYVVFNKHNSWPAVIACNGRFRSCPYVATKTRPKKVNPIACAHGAFSTYRVQRSELLLLLVQARLPIKLGSQSALIHGRNSKK